MPDTLILHTTTDTPAALADAVADALRRVDFIGEAFEYHGGVHFHPGDALPRLITFLGCAPTVDPTSTEGEAFCQVEIRAYPTLQFFQGSNTVPPRCLVCRHTLDDWKEVVARWHQDPPVPTRCPKCDTELGLASLNWRHHAAVANLAVVVWGVPLALVIPTDALLAKLGDVTGTTWDYAYQVP